jgi:hypothetical protein
MLKISFDFDETTNSVTNVKVVKTASKFENLDLPIVELGDSKLIMSPKAIELLSAQIGDRISVNYIQKNNELTFPVIGKSEVFTDKEAGNKLSKTNTVSFRGSQKTCLSQYGNLFKLEALRPGVFKMVKIEESELSEVDPEFKEETEILNTI